MSEKQAFDVPTDSPIGKAEQVWQQARAQIADHLPQACREVCDWRKSGRLDSEGIVWSVGDLLRSINKHHSVRMAEDIVITLALDTLSKARQAPHRPDAGNTQE